MPDKDHDEDKGLNDKLNESETDMKQIPPVLTELTGESSEIPVLDELVSLESDKVETRAIDQTDDIQHSIDDIAERIEKKLSTELDEIVTLLRDTLKDSIKSELKDQINKDSDKKTDE